MEDLRSFLDINKLIDLNVKENIYTWSNRRIGKGFIQRRLYKMMDPNDFIDYYQNSNLTSMPIICSDHTLIFLRLKKIKNKYSPLKFKNMWITHEKFKERILEWWGTNVLWIMIFWLTKKIDVVKINLKIWKKRCLRMFITEKQRRKGDRKKLSKKL